MEDSYEMVPYKDIMELKKDIEELKKGNSPELVASMRSLTSVINELIAIIKEAAKGMSEDSSGSLKSMSEKLDTIVAQNEKIADGLVAIGDMVENSRASNKEVIFNPNQPLPIQPMQFTPSIPPMNFNPPNDIPLPPKVQREMPDMDFNFTPQQSSGMPNFPQPKRKGLFGRFRK